MKYLINNKSQIPVLIKIYIWSLLLEPLHYFYILPQNITYIGGTLTRVLQVIVIIVLLFNSLLSLKIRFHSPFSFVSRNYTYFYIYSILIGLIGLKTGSYSISLIHTSMDGNLSPDFLQSTNFRPILEYVIALYYFVYFVVLAQYMLRKKPSLDYFFKWFSVVFLVVLFIGIIDLIVVYSGGNGLARHFYDSMLSINFPGARFHSLAGEPRDAFIYLISCIGIFILRDFWQKQNRLTTYWILIIFIALFLTASFSGVVGLIFSGVLLLIFWLPQLSLKKQISFILWFLFLIILIILNINTSLRMSQYLEGFLTLYQGLNNSASIDSRLFYHANNIFPIWHLWTEVRDWKLYHLFFGNGLGSASVINNYYYTINGVRDFQISNPNAGIIRFFYETGIIGIYLFIFAFIIPLKKLNLDSKTYFKLKTLMLIILGVYFSHRSDAPYLFFGIAMVVFRNRLMEIHSNVKLINKK